MGGKSEVWNQAHVFVDICVTTWVEMLEKRQILQKHSYTYQKVEEGGAIKADGNGF